jgi:hypothetical protein
LPSALGLTKGIKEAAPALSGRGAQPALAPEAVNKSTNPANATRTENRPLRGIFKVIPSIRFMFFSS